MVNNSQEEMDKKQRALEELQANPVHQEVLRLMQIRLRTKRQEQRQALLLSKDKDVFRLEAEICGMEAVFHIYDAQLIKQEVEKPTLSY